MHESSVEFSCGPGMGFELSPGGDVADTYALTCEWGWQWSDPAADLELPPCKCELTRICVDLTHIFTFSHSDSVVH